MAEFGGGIDLTKELDIDLNTVGDVQTISGRDELEKDVSLQSIIAVEPINGRQKTSETKTDLKRVIRDAIVADPRISEFRDISVSFIDGADEAEVVTTIVSSDEEQELVFSLPVT
jgi:hypothetical protein